MRNASIGLGLMLAGCGQFIESDIEIDTARPDMPDTADSDLPGVGALTVRYALVDDNGPTDCASVGVGLLHVVASGPAEPIEVDYPCDDEAIRLSDLVQGEWAVSLRGETSIEDGPFYAGSGETVVDGEIELQVTVACDANGWDDGCGGA